MMHLDNMKENLLKGKHGLTTARLQASWKNSKLIAAAREHGFVFYYKPSSQLQNMHVWELTAQVSFLDLPSEASNKVF